MLKSVPNKVTMIDKLVFVFAISIAEIRVFAHQEPASSGALVSSDETEVLEAGRRSLRPEWQYEGLPIEFPSRRYMEDQNEIEKKKDAVRRRSSKKTKKYKGLAIEIPRIMRKSEKHRIVKENTTKTTTAPVKTTTTTTTTTTTPEPNPPLDPRYRRIYNPDDTATIEEFPFMAALMVNGELWCGAVVIAQDSALTAAHCLQLQYNNRFFREYVKMLSLRVGSTNASYGGEVNRVSEIYFHPNYKPQTLEFNVALLKIHKNMSLGKEDPRVDMITYSRDKVVPVDNKVLFLGWGSVLGVGGTGGQVLLQKLELPVYDLADCQEVYGRELVTRNNFCAGYITLAKNVCNHDAGGPAIMDGQLIGILSFSAKRCDQADQPAVFSSIGPLASWLEGIGDKKIQLRNTAIKST